MKFGNYDFLLFSVQFLSNIHWIKRMFDWIYFNKRVLEISKKYKDAIIIFGGDFNTLFKHLELEILNKIMKNRFVNLTGNKGTYDLRKISIKKYRWLGYLGFGKNIKLDYIFTQKNILSKWNYTYKVYNNINISDHKPVEVCLYKKD